MPGKTQFTGAVFVFHRQSVYDAIRGDSVYPFRGGIHFGPAHCFMGGDDLAVDIGTIDPVAVYQGQLAHAGSGQNFGHIAAHAADAEYGHMTVLKPLDGGAAQQHFRPDQFFFHGASSFHKTPALDSKAGVFFCIQPTAFRPKVCTLALAPS